MQSCFDERGKNILAACIVMGMAVAAMAPSVAVMNIALEESTDIGIEAGYHYEFFNYGASMLVPPIANLFYKRVGIRASIGLGALLTSTMYWNMIWIHNQYTLYAAGIFTGMGWGCLWSLAPMIVADNSAPEQASRNMGFFWSATSIGAMVGGLVNYFYFLNVIRISTKNRITVYTVCVGFAVISAVVAALGLSERRKHEPLAENENVNDNEEAVKNPPPYEEVVETEFITDETDEKPSATSWKYHKDLLYKMSRRVEVWVLILPLIYWGFIWGYFMKILPTATASVSDKRSLIPLSPVINGASFLIGSVSWNVVIKKAGSIATVSTATIMLLAALLISLLTFPRGAMTEIAEDVTTIDTYVAPSAWYVVVICALIGLADSGVSIVYYTVVGRIWAEDTALGYCLVQTGFCVFYILAMTAPSLFDLHVYIYCMFGSVLVMCGSFMFPLRKLL